MGGDRVRAILAGNLKLYRGRRNWSQADLAEKSDLSVVYLSDIERGNKWPYLDTLVKLAAAFEMEVFELLKPQQDALSADTASFVEKFSEETAAIIEKSLETMRKNILQSLLNLRDQYLSG
ncbi:MAG: helix-turn-helix domain-containing protein [Treponema sp.]|jgi:transcriptional regulator with XRE-family HTH domain|nr:helix-turn-helix domain-containing protein [Treponema sp.]